MTTQFDGLEMLLESARRSALIEFYRLTGSEAENCVHCRRCKKPIGGIGDCVLIGGGQTALVRTGYDFSTEQCVGVEVLGSQICRRDFVAVCPSCDEETKVFVRR